MMYAKLVDGKLIFAPVNLVDGAVTHYHPTEEMLYAVGYRPLVETDPPVWTEGEVNIYVPSYEMQEGNIVQVWTEMTMDGI